MTDKTNLSLTLAQEDVQKILQKTIETQVATALEANGGQLVAGLVTILLNQKVDDEGRPSSSSYHTRSLLTWSVERGIRDVARAALSKWVDANAQKLEAEFTKALTRETKSIAATMVSSLVNGSRKDWHIGVTFNNKDDR